MSNSADSLAYLGQQVLTNAIHNLLPGETTASASPLGLSVHDDLYSRLHLEGSEGQVCIGVQPKDFRALLTWQILNGLQRSHAKV